MYLIIKAFVEKSAEKYYTRIVLLQSRTTFLLSGIRIEPRILGSSFIFASLFRSTTAAPQAELLTMVVFNQGSQIFLGTMYRNGEIYTQ
jgi:hypothetical protein